MNLYQCPKCFSLKVIDVFGSETNGEPLGECLTCGLMISADWFKEFPQPRQISYKYFYPQAKEIKYDF